MSSVISDRLGSLSKEHGKSEQKKEKEKEKDKEEREDQTSEATELNRSSGGGQLMQRCVIVQRDEKGYGLTVSGDNPVFVQSVKENGAAARAGVRQGDRIIKVNGTLVTNCNHVEVVNLIRAGSYVALTLLGRPPGQPNKLPYDSSLSTQLSPTTPIHRTGSERISGPRQVNAEKEQECKTQTIATIRMMYEQVANEYEKMKAEYARNPSEQLHEKLQEKQKTVRTLEQQLFNLTGIPAESHLVSPGAARSPPMGLPPPAQPPPSQMGHFPPSMHHIRRYGSGDHLNRVSENQENAYEGVYSQSPGANPAPWLSGGPKHRKADSMPETLYESEEPLSRDATVVRSHSDSRRQKPHAELHEGASAEEIEKLRTSSLPTSVYDTENLSDHSPHQSPTASPYPAQAREAWTEGFTETTEEGVTQPEIVTLEAPSPSGRVPSPKNVSPSPEPHHGLTVVAPHQVNVISMEDEEFSTDDEHSPSFPVIYHSVSSSSKHKSKKAKLDEHGPFSDLNVLKHKPAHLAVFLHYLISNSDPSPLLFYLVTETYPHGSMKEMRKWAYEIHSTFLVDKAPMRVNVDDAIISNIDIILASKYDKEDVLRSIFQLARHIAQNEISELLADFRNKRALGLGSIYGDHELQDDNMDRQTEMRIIEKYLLPHFERLIEDSEASDRTQSDRNQAMASALATFLKQVGFQFSGRNSGALERCMSFTTKDKKFKFTKSNRKAHFVKGHHLAAQHYYTVTMCNLCQSLLWGIGNQGFQCVNCEYNVHKQCVDKIKDYCSGSKKKKDKRQSMLDKIITRKPSTNNPAAIPPYHREAQKWNDEGYNSPNTTPSSSAFHIRSSTANKDEEEEDLDAPRSHRVNRLVERYENARSPEDTQGQSPVTPPRSRSPETTTDTDDQKKYSSLSRSESFNRKRKTQKNVRRTRSDVHVDDQTLKALNQSASSSNSSISVSLDSPSHSREVLNDIATNHQGSRSHPYPYDDSDYDTEADMPTLETIIPKEILKKLKPKEKKRQDVINELFHTERAHVRNLKVMHRLFYLPMLNEEWIAFDLTRLLFPNIEEMIQVHSLLNNSFKMKKKESLVVNEVADMLLQRFDGEAGEKFRNACAIFCRNQSHGLDVLRNKQRKDQKLENFLKEISSNPLCRRLELKDLIPTAMQRLTKYPLLIDSLLKYTPSNTDEYHKLQRALSCSREILMYVDQAVKDCENHQKLVDLQRRLDRRPVENSTHPVVAEFKNLDLTRHKMIYDGALTWRIGRTKQIDLHVILLEDILVLLQKQDDKLVLKCQSTTVVAGKEDTKFTHSPIIKLTNLLTRNVATDKRAFFLVSTSEVGPQIYELVAVAVDEKKKWFKHITEAAEAYKGKEGRNNRKNAHIPHTEPPPVPHEEDKGMETPERKRSKEEPEPVVPDSLDRNKSSSVDSLENVEKVEVLQINQPELIQPTEVVISDAVVERAEPILTPLEMLKRKHELIEKTLGEKQKIVSDILQIPPGEFEHIAEMAGEIEGEKEARELVLASIQQSDTLTGLLNDGLMVSDKEAADAQREHEEEGATASTSKEDEKAAVTVALPADKLRTVSAKLNEQLTYLLNIIAERDEERERMQQELKLANEQLGLLRDTTLRSPSNSIPQRSRPNSYISVTSSTSETGEAQEEPQAIHSSSDESAFYSASSPSRTSVMTASQSNTDFDNEKFQMVEPIAVSVTLVPAEETAEAIEEEGFVDCSAELEPETAETEGTVTASTDTSDSVSCDTTDTDSTGNTVVGASF